MSDDKMPELKPCPFCKGTNTQFRENGHWTGMRTEVTSVDVYHWCDFGDGLTSLLKIRGKTHQQAAERWNNGCNENVQHLIDQAKAEGYDRGKAGFEEAVKLAKAEQRKKIEQAFMAGQADCSVDPSYSSAQSYAILTATEDK